MQTIRKNLTEEWVEFATFINDTVSTDDKYRIYNRGNGKVLLLETDTAPSASSVDGEPLLVDERVTFTKPSGSTLYMRVENGESILNIVEVD